MTWGAHRIRFYYGSTVALRDVTLEARRGAVSVLVGADGAGKTTMLKILAGVLDPAEGRVTRPDKHRIGYMSAGPGVYPDLTVEENLSFAARAYGMRESEFASRSGDLLEHTDLAGFKDRLAGRLSGGMRRKLALAAALLHAPDLLVLDEPTTGVDPVSRAELWRLISRAAAEGAAVVLATSYIDEAERATEVVVLDEGRALATGTPETILQSTRGALYYSERRADPARSWRRAGRWLTWSPDGTPIDGGRPIVPDLEDAVVIAALAASGVG